MARGQTLGRVIILLLLILVMAAGSLVWFDYLGVIDAKTVLAPVYQRLGFSSRKQPPAAPDEVLSLDNERLAVRLEALEMQKAELDKRSAEMGTREGELSEMAAELEDRQRTLDERERSMAQAAEETKSKDANVEQTARWLNGMPPQDAVAILSTMDDQDAIDVFRKLEAIAAAEGGSSIVSYWLSLYPDKAQAATLLRKLSNAP